MTEFPELATLAKQLIDEEEYFSRHKPACLQAWIRDKGKCVYCECDLFKSYETASATDHLIPRKRLMQDSRLDLMWDVRNLVACCAECNQLKRDYDAAEGEAFTSIEDLLKQRTRLVNKVEAQIRLNRSARPDWESMFDRARKKFQEAVEKYQCG